MKHWNGKEVALLFRAAHSSNQRVLGLLENARPERPFVVLAFDTNVFIATKDGGTTWTTLGAGLKRTDLKHVYAASSGWIASLNTRAA